MPFLGAIRLSSGTTTPSWALRVMADEPWAPDSRSRTPSPPPPYSPSEDTDDDDDDDDVTYCEDCEHCRFRALTAAQAPPPPPPPTPTPSPPPSPPLAYLILPNLTPGEYYNLNPRPWQLSSGWYFFSRHSTTWYRFLPRPQSRFHHRDSLPVPGVATEPSPASSNSWAVYQPSSQQWSRPGQDPDTMSSMFPTLLPDIHPSDGLCPSPHDLIEGWYYYSSESQYWWAFQNTLNSAVRGWWYFVPSLARWVFGTAGHNGWCPCCPRGTIACENVDENGRYFGPGCEGPTLENQSAESP